MMDRVGCKASPPREQSPPSRWQVKTTPPPASTPPAALTSPSEQSKHSRWQSWQVKGSTPPTPPPPASTPPAALTSACSSQPWAGGSIATSAAPKRAPTWSQPIGEEEDDEEEEPRVSAPQTQPVPPPLTQPLAGTASPQTQPVPPPQTPPSVLQAPPQPLAGDARGDDSDDYDYEGLDSRTAVGEQSCEEETALAERQGEDSEGDEIVLWLKVAAVVRVQATHKRFATTPYERFHPAVGGGGVAAELDTQVHWLVCRVAEGVEFTLTSLSEKDDLGRWLVPAQNYHTITRRHDVMKRQWKALVPSSWDGWRLVDKLPGTDDLSGIPMSDSIVASRWQRDHEMVLKHLLGHTRGIG